MSRPVVGIVLAGGQSRRLGRDKALVRFHGETLVDRAVRRLRTCCDEIAVADRGRSVTTAARSLDDGPGRGPAAGILGAAAAFPRHDLLVLACDLPLVPVALLRWLATRATGDWALPRHPRGVEPLCAYYRPAALDALAAQVATGDFALHHLADAPSLTIEPIEGDALDAFGDPDDWLLNLNRHGDLDRLAAQQSGR